MGCELDVPQSGAVYFFALFNSQIIDVIHIFRLHAVDHGPAVTCFLCSKHSPSCDSVLHAVCGTVKKNPCKSSTV